MIERSIKFWDCEKKLPDGGTGERNVTFAGMFNDWKDIVDRYSQISVFTVTRQTLFHHTETEYAHIPGIQLDDSTR